MTDVITNSPICMTVWHVGPVAQRITRLNTDHKIPGSIPDRVGKVLLQLGVPLTQYYWSHSVPLLILLYICFRTRCNKIFLKHLQIQTFPFFFLQSVPIYITINAVTPRNRCNSLAQYFGQFRIVLQFNISFYSSACPYTNIGHLLVVDRRRT